MQGGQVVYDHSGADYACNPEYRRGYGNDQSVLRPGKDYPTAIYLRHFSHK